MKVLVLADVLTSKGGLEQAHLRYSAALAGRGHEICLLYERDGDMTPSWMTISAAHRRIETARPSRGGARAFGGSAKRTIEFSAAHRPDVLYLSRHGQVALGLLASRLSSSVVCHVHTPPPRERFLRRHLPLVRHVDRWIAVSSFTAKRWIDAGVPAERMTVVHNGVDTRTLAPDPEMRARTRASLGLSPTTFLVMYAGRLDPKKGIDTLLRAWRQVGGWLDDARLMIVGAPSHFLSSGKARVLMDDLQGRADGSVSFLGHRSDVLPLMQAADAVAVPSVWQDPFPLVVIEAMSTGTPVVASRVGGIPEALDGGLEHLLVPPGDEMALAAKLRELASTSRVDLSETLRQRAVERFDLARAVDGIERVLSGSDLSSGGKEVRCATPRCRT